MNRVKELRKRSGMQQKELAIVLGVKQPSVSRWEAQKADPTDENAKQMAELFGVSVSHILCRDESISDEEYDYSSHGVAIRKAYQPKPESAPSASALSDADIAAIAQRVRSLDDAPAVRLTPAEQQFLDSFRLLSTTQKHRVQAMVAGFLDARELNDD